MKSLCLTIASALFALSSCADAELGKAPFLCNNGSPKCPEGYSCHLQGGRNVCIKDGEPVPDAGIVVDQRLVDGPPRPDGAADGGADKGPTPDGPSQVKVVVTEFMPHPNAVQDAEGEWIELFNPTNQPIDIEGWTLKDANIDTHTISRSVIIPANGFIVIGRSDIKATNGGVDVAYAYGPTFFLANTTDEIILLDKAGLVVLAFMYNASTFPISEGTAVSLKDPNSNPDDAGSWCAEGSAWSGSAGDRGTPGKPPGC
jgi:hypothetical protein